MKLGKEGEIDKISLKRRRNPKDGNKRKTSWEEGLWQQKKGYRGG